MRLTDRDKQIIMDICRFNGLPTQTISMKYFEGQNYCNRRLSILEKEGYINRIYYYVGDGINTGIKKSVEGRSV